jgi:FkbM family methyltransferase
MMKKLMDKILKFVIYRLPVIAFFLRRVRDKINNSRKPTQTEFGFLLKGNKMMEAGNFEVEETRLIRKLICKIDVFINIGANIGYYCCFTLHSEKKTIAFEPLPENLKFLYQNIEFNRWGSRIEIHPVALSERIGITKLYGMGTGASLIEGWAGNSKYYYHNVPVNTLDNIISNRFLEDNILIMIDVEGAEYGVLKGAINLIKREKRPIWFIEISIAEHQPVGRKINSDLLDTFELFWNSGYRSVVADSSLREINYSDIKKIVDNQEDTLRTHNFIFFDEKIDFKSLIN